jgi:hypothetical protein
VVVRGGMCGKSGKRVVFGWSVKLVEASFS